MQVLLFDMEYSLLVWSLKVSIVNLLSIQIRSIDQGKILWCSNLKKKHHYNRSFEVSNFVWAVLCHITPLCTILTDWCHHPLNLKKKKFYCKNYFPFLRGKGIGLLTLLHPRRRWISCPLIAVSWKVCNTKRAPTLSIARLSIAASLLDTTPSWTEYYWHVPWLSYAV